MQCRYMLYVIIIVRGTFGLSQGVSTAQSMTPECATRRPSSMSKTRSARIPPPPPPTTPPTPPLARNGRAPTQRRRGGAARGVPPSDVNRPFSAGSSLLTPKRSRRTARRRVANISFERNRDPAYGKRDGNDGRNERNPYGSNPKKTVSSLHGRFRVFTHFHEKHEQNTNISVSLIGKTIFDRPTVAYSVQYNVSRKRIRQNVHTFIWSCSFMRVTNAFSR